MKINNLDRYAIPAITGQGYLLGLSQLNCLTSKFGMEIYLHGESR